MTPEVGVPYRWTPAGDAPPRVERLTIEETESGSGIARLARLHREMVLARLDRESTLDLMLAVIEAGFRRPDPPRPAPWAVVPCGRPRPGMGVAVPNTERVTMRNVTPRLERRR